MGTHPIFESDFDCLTDWNSRFGDLEPKKRDFAEMIDCAKQS